VCHIAAVPDSKNSEPTVEGPTLERSIALTDAVVAIAMTLLVLPLVELANEVDSHDLGRFLREHWDVMLSFGVSFVVIYIFWAAHGTAFRRLAVAGAETPPALRQLNLWWLLLIAFLPFPTAVVGRDLNTASAPVYIGTMLVLSGLTTAMMVVVGRVMGPSRRVRWAWLTTAVFGLCTLLSLVNADLGLFALLLLAVVRVIEVRVLR
jgi:uncharacterized membrane protein